MTDEGKYWLALILSIVALIVALLTLLLSAASANASAPRCMSRYDAAFNRVVTTCRDGTKAISRYDRQRGAWRTEITPYHGGNDGARPHERRSR